MPLSLLELWGRFGFLVGFALMLCAFGGFTLRPGGRWGLGRERQSWDAKALLSSLFTFVLIIVTGYIGSFIVLVPGAQTFESLKDLSVFLCIVLFGYPALIVVPFAYGLSDLAEGVPPAFLLDWLVGYFINPACFWVAHQLIGKSPDFRMGRTWLRYLAFVALFMGIEPQLWGYICADKFTPEISYRNITPALAFTTAITWLLAPLAMLAALPLARRFGMYWAEVPGRVKERLLWGKEWIWVSGRAQARGGADDVQAVPIRMLIATPFIALMLLMVGITAYVTLRSAEDDAVKLAGRLHEEIAENINLQLDDYLDTVQATATTPPHLANINALLKSLPIARQGRAFILDRAGHLVASSNDWPVASTDNTDPVAQRALEHLAQSPDRLSSLKGARQFRFDVVTAKPLSRETWLTQITAYQDRRGGHADWVVLTAMPESYYLGGIQAGNAAPRRCWPWRSPCRWQSRPCLRPS